MHSNQYVYLRIMHRFRSFLMSIGLFSYVEYYGDNYDLDAFRKNRFLLSTAEGSRRRPTPSASVNPRSPIRESSDAEGVGRGRV